MAKIINLFGGPGTGKSTLASGLFYNMKLLNYNVEFVQEFAKELVYENRTNVLKHDQLFVLANQNRNLLIKAFEPSIDYIIMESPILLSNVYFNELSIYSEKIFKDFVLDLFNKYNNINFYLKRSSVKEFSTTGRIHSEYESKLIDLNILRYLESNSINFYKIDIDNNSINKIIELIKK